MPTITNVSNGALPEASKRSYIAAAAFQSVIFTYVPPVLSPYGAIVTPGQLLPFNTNAGSPTGAALGGADCPAKRILRETGKKLFPGVHSGVRTPMVSVYDNIRMWHGYIDPSSPFFAVFSTNMPNFFTNPVDAATGSPADAGVPVITNGLVNASLSVTAGTSVSAGTTVTAGTFVYAGSGIGYATGSGGSVTQLNTKSDPVTLNKPTGIIITNIAQLNAGNSVEFRLNNTFIDANDIVVLNWNYGGYNIKTYVNADNQCDIQITNFTGGDLSEAISIRFAVIKAAIA